MERSLRIIASSLALLCGSTLPAPAQPSAAEASPPFDDASCEPGLIEHMTLDEAQQRHCRQLLQGRIEAMRQRSREHVRQVIEDNRIRREREASLSPPPSPPVTVESFISRGDLAYGDVVVTDGGPRVFVGKPGEPPAPDDFVALDAPRSPHRGRTRPYDGAYPERRQIVSPKPQRTAPSFQERQP